MRESPARGSQPTGALGTPRSRTALTPFVPMTVGQLGLGYAGMGTLLESRTSKLSGMNTGWGSGAEDRPCPK